ncbi:hypothetical protein BT69DRAFT_1291653 [Atractiella rhizophila]|nr:hypothetical protein BT69DRAFT_1291653 [Atractiella rhizophila]
MDEVQSVQEEADTQPIMTDDNLNGDAKMRIITDSTEVVEDLSTSLKGQVQDVSKSTTGNATNSKSLYSPSDGDDEVSDEGTFMDHNKVKAEDKVGEHANDTEDNVAENNKSPDVKPYPQPPKPA